MAESAVFSSTLFWCVQRRRLVTIFFMISMYTAQRTHRAPKAHLLCSPSPWRLPQPPAISSQPGRGPAHAPSRSSSSCSLQPARTIVCTHIISSSCSSPTPRLIYALSRLGHATPAEGALLGVRNAQVRRPNSASVRDEYNRQSSCSSWHLQLANGMPGTASGGNLNREGSLRALMPIEALVRSRSPWCRRSPHLRQRMDLASAALSRAFCSCSSFSFHSTALSIGAVAALDSFAGCPSRRGS